MPEQPTLIDWTGSEAYSWFYPPREPGYVMNPVFAEQQVRVAYQTLCDAVQYYEANKTFTSGMPIPIEDVYGLAGCCQDLGEQVNKIITFARDYDFSNPFVKEALDVLITLRNKISHEASIWISPQQIYRTARAIVYSPIYVAAIDQMLLSLESDRPELFAMEGYYVDRNDERQRLKDLWKQTKDGKSRGIRLPTVWTDVLVSGFANCLKPLPPFPSAGIRKE